jgi:hypothetical protein
MILRDLKIVSEILSSSEVSPGFFGGFPPFTPLNENVFYLYFDGCLFPSLIENDCLVMNAAVPKSRRGLRAVSAGKAAIDWVVSNLDVRKVVGKVKKNRKDVMLYITSVGMSRFKEDENYIYYEVSHG